jgi:hypothetical protein
MNTTFTHIGTYVVEFCFKCGIGFGMPQGFYNEARDDTSKTFYCPNGHGQVYTTSERTRLRRQLDSEREENNTLRYRIQHVNRSRAALKGQVTKIKRRVGKGVCPCCRRNFANLRRHMEGQHPDWSEE